MQVAADIRKRLDILRVVAVADALLLVVLLLGLALDWHVAPVVGPIHGFGFLVMLYLTARGAADGLWGWWFPAVVVVTLGPPGSLYGDLRVRRALAAPAT